MTHRILLLCMVLILAPARPSLAVRPTPEVLARLRDPADVALFTSEPCSTSPPLALRNAIAGRLATAGTVHLNMVVLLTEFSDNLANHAVSTPAHYDSILFSRGVYPTGSLADYLLENSNGRLILDGSIRGWYMMPRTYATYVFGQAGRGQYPYNTQGLAYDAIRMADPELNYALFDSDGPDGVPDTFDDDQYVDLIMVIHAGAGGESAGSRYSLQSVAWWLPETLPLDGVYAQMFATTPEDAGMGVYGHESLHLFGLPDLYDATGSSFGLGTWTIMAGGWSLNEARTPVHLDPWCKARLGFITPIPVTSTLDDVVFDPVEQGGDVYRLGAYGSTTSLEYFLVENREQIGFDSFLPGAGLLIYHVNELNASNNIPGRYLVGLEQADGLFQLDNFYGNPSFGDAGDPYTEATPSGGFGRISVPDSRNQNGEETGVTVYQIRGPDASHRIIASLRAIKGGVVTLDSLNIVPLGNGDAYLAAGESFEVRPSFTIRDGTAHNLTLQIETGDPNATVAPMPVILGDLPPGSYHDIALGVNVAPTLPSDPYSLGMHFRIDYRDELPVRREVTAGAGETRGMVDDFENGFGKFTHHPMRSNFYDLWSQQATGGSTGPHAWRCGLPVGGFYAKTDAALETQLFIVPPDAVLRFDQIVEIPAIDSGLAVAGAFVEISVNGGAWTQITPTRGYDAQFFSANREFNNRFIFTGDASGPDPPWWENVSFILPASAGSAAVIRFRGFATASVPTGQGWWIDNVRIESSSTPVLLASLSAVHVAEGVRLQWTLAAPEEMSGVLVFRSPAGGETWTRLSPDPLSPDFHGEFVDLDPLANEAVVYRLDAVGRDGSRFELGRLRVEPEAWKPTRQFLSAYPNPARGPVGFEFSVGVSGPVKLMVFDAAGRPVREIVSSRLDAGQYRFEWDSRDAFGRMVPAGVYFYRLEQPGSPGAPRSRKLVVVR